MWVADPRQHSEQQHPFCAVEPKQLHFYIFPGPQPRPRHATLRHLFFCLKEKISLDIPTNSSKTSLKQVEEVTPVWLDLLGGDPSLWWNQMNCKSPLCLLKAGLTALKTAIPGAIVGVCSPWFFLYSTFSPHVDSKCLSVAFVSKVPPQNVCCIGALVICFSWRFVMNVIICLLTRTAMPCKMPDVLLLRFYSMSSP